MARPAAALKRDSSTLPGASKLDGETGVAGDIGDAGSFDAGRAMPPGCGDAPLPGTYVSSNSTI